jgi:hypothetical protein
MTDNLWKKTARLFCENAIRFKAGRRMMGTVNKVKGY